MNPKINSIILEGIQMNYKSRWECRYYFKLDTYWRSHYASVLMQWLLIIRWIGFHFKLIYNDNCKYATLIMNWRFQQYLLEETYFIYFTIKSLYIFWSGRNVTLVLGIYICMKLSMRLLEAGIWKYVISVGEQSDVSNVKCAEAFIRPSIPSVSQG